MFQKGANLAAMLVVSRFNYPVYDDFIANILTMMYRQSLLFCN